MIPTLNTKRLVLRQMLESDFESYCDYALDEKVMQYIMPIGTLEEIKQHFNGYADAWDAQEGKWMGLAVQLKDTGDLIGDIGFRYKSKEHQQIELGYKFNKNYHGKGYGSEAMDAFVNHIDQNWDFHKLVAYCDPRNTASFKLMQRYGMKQEGLFKEHFKFGDEWQDELAYGVLKKNLIIPK